MSLSLHPDWPLVYVSSVPPHRSRISAFAEDQLEFLNKHHPERRPQVLTFSDQTPRGEANYDVIPCIDLANPDWPALTAARICAMQPYVVHIQHDADLYAAPGEDERTAGAQFFRLLDGLREHPVIVEAHHVHGRLTYAEEDFLADVADRCTILLFKCDYQKWRLEWAFAQAGRRIPRNIAAIPHGARPDRHYSPWEIDGIKDELGLTELKGKRLVGLIGWIHGNKRWDIVSNLWAEVQEAINMQTGEEWKLFAAGSAHASMKQSEYDHLLETIRSLEKRGLARFYPFEPHGEMFYKVLALCDFLVLPTLEETQSSALSHIIALNKPYITTAPLEGLTAQTVESEGGLLFTNRETLRRAIIRLATQEDLRWRLGEKLRSYLLKRVSWDVVIKQILNAYRLARISHDDAMPIRFPLEFESSPETEQHPLVRAR